MLCCDDRAMCPQSRRECSFQQRAANPARLRVRVDEEVRQLDVSSTLDRSGHTDNWTLFVSRDPIFCSHPL